MIVLQLSPPVNWLVFYSWIEGAPLHTETAFSSWYVTATKYKQPGELDGDS